MVYFYLLNKLTRCTHCLSGYTEKFVLQSKARSLTCYEEVLAGTNGFEGWILLGPENSPISQLNYWAVTLASQKGYVTGQGSNLGPIKFNLITRRKKLCFPQAHKRKHRSHKLVTRLDAIQRAKWILKVLKFTAIGRMKIQNKIKKLHWDGAYVLHCAK